MAHDILSGASQKNVFKPRSAMGGDRDEIRFAVTRLRANLLSRMTDLYGRFDLDSIPVGLLNKIAHLLFRRFVDLLQQKRKIISSVFIASRRSIATQSSEAESVLP